MATINDVAARAGVSRTTTSRVLNNHPRVDDETRRRVLVAIDELRYVPSPTARRLSLGRTWTVDVVASYLTRPQAMERLRGAESVLGDSAFDIVIHNVESPDRRERYLRQLPTSNRTDGVLLVSLPPASENLHALAAGPVPVVLIDVHGPVAAGLPVVRGDDVAGGGLVARYLHTGPPLHWVRRGRVREPVRLHLEPGPVRGVQAGARRARRGGGGRARRTRVADRA